MSPTYSSELKEQVVQEVSETHNATRVARRLSRTIQFPQKRQFKKAKNGRVNSSKTPT